MTKNQEEHLDAFHRKQLRKVLGIRYPTKISNSSLYKKTEETRLSTTIREARWKLLGHVLRWDKSISANKAMGFYFSKRGEKGFRGRRVTTLPVTLVRDLEQMYTSVTSLQDHQYFRRL